MAHFDESFEALVASTQERYEKASSNWMPDPGEYTCLLTQLTGEVRVNPQDDQQYLQVQPTWQIIGHPTLADTPFRGDRYSDRTMNSLGMLKDFVSKAIGTPSGNLKTDLATLSDLCGRLICRIKVTKSRDGKYTNARLDEVEQTLPAGDTAVAA